MEERFIKGIAAGAGAGIVKDILGFLFHNIFKTVDLSYWDYVGIVVMGSHPRSFLEHAYSFLVEINFSILIGMIYLFIIPYLETKYRLLRGAIYGLLVWFIIQAGITVFHIEILQNKNSNTMIAVSLLSLMYGIVFEWIIQAMEKHNNCKLS